MTDLGEVWLLGHGPELLLVDGEPGVLARPLLPVPGLGLGEGGGGGHQVEEVEGDEEEGEGGHGSLVTGHWPQDLFGFTPQDTGILWLATQYPGTPTQP